ncbi:hypothetical protein PMAC_002393 [Pneumocystis sp. 'macacae']|nr:hypothetical protein PMAC_002393 [Pneumocystis sp. 'macacae']
MSDLTKIFFEYSNKHNINILETKIRNNVQKKRTEDLFIKEAYQIFKHIKELEKFLTNIRHAYLNIESREPIDFQSFNKQHTSVFSYKGLKTLSDRQREEVDTKSKIIIKQSRERILKLENFEKNSANILSIQTNKQNQDILECNLNTSLSKEQIQLLETENNEIFEYFQSTLDQVRSIQKSLSEISKIQTELASHIEEQSYITNKLHEEVLYTSELIKNGSTQLIHTKKVSKTSSRFITWFLLISSSILLLLDWYN